LADSGLGGERSRGWGRAEEPEFVEGELPDMILPPQTPPPTENQSEAAPPAATAHWILSLFTPGPKDQVDWNRGNYSTLLRGGRIESRLRSGELKKQIQMIAEGSVLVASNGIYGAATNVAPDDFPHPVFRAGFALSIPIPEQVP
jgi:CRISPR type III-A-associated RAMP protein Csm4